MRQPNLSHLRKRVAECWLNALTNVDAPWALRLSITFYSGAFQWLGYCAHVTAIFALHTATAGSVIDFPRSQEISKL